MKEHFGIAFAFIGGGIMGSLMTAGVLQFYIRSVRRARDMYEKLAFDN